MNRPLQIIFILLFCYHASLCQNAGRSHYYYNPQFSPDGSHIVFESTRNGKSSIYTITTKGKELKRISDTLSDYGQPAWSPDGKHLVYFGSKHPMQLFVNTIAGGEQKMLPTSDLDAYEPTWSVKNKLAFDIREMGQAPNDIATMNIDGSGYLKLTNDSRYDCSSPEWSPDGELILFNRSAAIHKSWKDITKEEMEQKKKTNEIIIMNSHGLETLTIVMSLNGESAPFWSKDGTAIYYLIKSGEEQKLYHVVLNEMKPESILTLTGVVYSVSISPDGKYATYAAERDKKHAIYRYDLKKNKEKKLIGE